MKILRKPSVTDERQSWVELQRWYRSPLGELYAESETALLADILTSLFGYHILALGVPCPRDLLAASPIAHHCHLDYAQCPQGFALDVLAKPDQLPIAGDSVDVVVVSHVLEFVAEPHGVLREVDRILIPEGHVVIVGFNPFSFWGLWGLFSRRGKTPWDGRFLSVTRTRDWLALLGFEARAVHYCFYRPPLKRRGLLGKLAFLEKLGARWWPCGGGGYMLVAKKRVSTLTLIKPRWQARRRVLTEGIANHPLRKYRRD
jgi:SAM-dependent methyltransferase